MPATSPQRSTTTGLVTQTSDDATRLEVHVLARYVLDRFGPTLTAYMANSRSRSLPPRWAAEPGTPASVRPRGEVEKRLRVAYAIAVAIDAAENSQITRAWFMAANPRLGGRTPAELIREGDIPTVYPAAVAFVEGSYNA